MGNLPNYNNILLPIDGSECSKKAGKHALWIADIDNANIIILHVVDTHILQSGYAGFFKEDLYDILMDKGKQIIERFKVEIKEYQNKCSQEINIKTQLKEGEPYDEIIKTVNDDNIDLVVMGASGMHGINRLLLGSVTERVVRKSVIPVLIVHYYHLIIIGFIIVIICEIY